MHTGRMWIWLSLSLLVTLIAASCSGSPPPTVTQAREEATTARAAAPTATSLGTIVDGWTGTVVRMPPMAQFDDYLLRSDGEKYGLDGSAAGLNAEIVQAREEEAEIRVWGKLLIEIPDVGGRQIVIERLEFVGRSTAPSPDTAVDGWAGTVAKLDPMAQFDDYFRRSDGEKYGIDGSVAGFNAEIEQACAQGLQVQVWGKLLIDVPDTGGRQIVVERLEAVPGIQPISRVQEYYGTAYEIILTANPQDSRQTDISVRQRTPGNELYHITLAEVYLEHYHNVEFVGGNLYVIHRRGYDGETDSEWTDELWRYDAQKQGVRLYESQGLDFRVAVSEDIAVRTNNGTLLFLDAAGNPKQEYTVQQLGNQSWTSLPAAPGIFLRGWDDASVFWGTLEAPGVLAFFRVERDFWRVTSYDLSQLPIAGDYDLYLPTGKLAYSDYPMILDAERAQKFQESGQPVTLYVYDLESRTSQTVATSAARAFHPRWLSKAHLEYDNPQGEGRIKWAVPWPTAGPG